MGDINPSKMPKGKKTARRDDTDFMQYAKGGAVWNTPNPAKKSKELTDVKKTAAKSRARKSWSTISKSDR